MEYLHINSLRILSISDTEHMKEMITSITLYFYNNIVVKMNHGQMEINPSFCMIFKQHNQRNPGFLDQYVIWCHNLMKLTYADLLMARELIQSDKKYTYILHRFYSTG